MLDEISEPDYAKAVGDRVEELIWVLDHEADLDADFLAIYGIDLEQADAMTAPRYFALAHRLTAYQGVMAARVEEEREEQQPQSSSTPTRTQNTAPSNGGTSEVTELSLTQFRAKFPGLVSVTEGG